MDAAVGQIESARHSICLLGRVIESRRMGDALIAARGRGVDVQVILDAPATSENRAEALRIAQAGVPIYLDARHATTRANLILIDEQTLLTGSFDFSTHADDLNNSDLLILHNDLRLLSAYSDNFRRHLSHAERFQPN